MDWKRYKVRTPTGARGLWAVERFVVDEAAAEAANSKPGRAIDDALDMMCGDPEPVRAIEPGEYTRLVEYGRDGNPYERWCWMSDVRPEIEEHAPLFKRAHGDVLIHGLGIGMAALAVAKMDAVRSVLVIERQPEVMHLVAPWVCEHPKVRVLQGDAFDWELPSGARWDVVWHDIWRDLSGDSVAEMVQLEARFAGRCSWQGSWQREGSERRAAKIRALRSSASIEGARAMPFDGRVLLLRMLYYANGGPPVRPLLQMLGR